MPTLLYLVWLLLIVTLTLNTVILFFFHKTLWLMMMYHQTKFCCQGINSSENKRIFWSYEPCCHLDLEDSKDALAHDAASPYQIWKQNVLWFRKYRTDKHSLTFSTFVVTLTLNEVILFFNRTLRLMMLYYTTTFGCRRASSFEDIVEMVIFWLFKPLLWSWPWK